MIVNTNKNITTCTFFGHRDAPIEVEPLLKQVIIDLIENHNVNKFYIGNNGNFDVMAKNLLKSIKEKYKHIEYFIVLAYLPTKRNEFDYTDYSNSIYFDELNLVPKKLAIYKRNEIMLKKSNFIVTYIKHSFGGAAIFKELAKKQNKHIINIT